MDGLALILALAYLAFLVFLLVKFIQLCNDTRDIKNLLISNLQSRDTSISSSEETRFNTTKFNEGDLVVEKSTNKQLRLGKFCNGSWICLSNGQEYKELKESELYTWKDYLASIGK